MKARTQARGIALQVLYELDIANHPVGIVLKERLDEADMDEDLSRFIRSIVVGVCEMAPRLDEYITHHAPEWPLDQVAIIDRNILRIALWEFAVDGKTPLKVAINEAVELAKMYGSDSAPRFVNGVLGSLADRSDEIIEALENYRKYRE